MHDKYSLQMLLGRYEDHLTAMVALALELDIEFRDRAAALLLARLPHSNGEPPRISRVEVQRDFGGPCPDLTLTLDDGRLVLVENKLEAPETLGPAPSPPDSTELSVEPVKAPPAKQPQLVRYLHLAKADHSIRGLAFIRASRKLIDPQVLLDPLYLRPEGEVQHFLWRDFYPLLAACTNPITNWLRGAFEASDFTPPTGVIGDLTVPERRSNMAKLLDPMAEFARTLGWTVQRGSVVELWMTKHPKSVADYIWVSPTTERLLVRLRPHRSDELETLVAIAKSVQARLAPDFDIRLDGTRVRQKEGLRDVVNLSAPMSAIDTVGSAEQTQDYLQRFIGPIVRALSPL